MPAFEQVELHVITTKTQTPRVLFRSFGGVELVVTARDVQHGGTYAAGVRIVPIAGHRAAEGGHAADGIRVRPGKAIVERHGLGETKQHAPLRGDCQFASGFFQDVEYHLVVQADGLGRAAAGDPAVPNLIRPHPQEKAVRPLDGRDGVVRTHHMTGEREHVLGILTETVERADEHGPRADILRHIEQVAASQPRRKGALPHGRYPSPRR